MLTVGWNLRQIGPFQRQVLLCFTRIFFSKVLFHHTYTDIYGKALRCTFLGEWKNSCSSKFVQLELLNKAKARISKHHAAQGFHYINLCISIIFGPSTSKTCAVKGRSAWGHVSWGPTVVSNIFPRNPWNVFLTSRNHKKYYHQWCCTSMRQ